MLRIGGTKAEAGPEISREAAASLGPVPHCPKDCAHANPKANVCIYMVLSQSLSTNSLFLSCMFGFSTAIISTCFHQRETSHLPFEEAPAEWGNLAVREAKEQGRNCVPAVCCPPSPGAQWGPGYLGFPHGLQHCLPPPTKTLGSPGAARGVALITEGTLHLSQPAFPLFRSTGQAMHCAQEPVSLASLLTSVPFCFQREIGAGHARLRLCCLLAPARKRTTAMWETRPDAALQTGCGTHTSFSSEPLGFDFQEMMSDHTDREDQIPGSTVALAPYMESNLN